MFMVKEMFFSKDEYTNIKKLTMTRFICNKRYIVTFLIIMALILTVSLLSTIISVSQSSDTVQYHNTMDFSSFFLFGMILGYLVNSIFTYRSTNAKLSVFPQSNNSRFISALLYTYVFVIILATVLVTMYLIQYGIVKLISFFVSNLYFALDFDIGFIIAGFFAYLAYSFLVIAVIEFIGTILRKWTYYAVAAFVTFFAIFIMNFRVIIDKLSNIFSFLGSEPSLVLFFLKAIGLWLVITLVSLVINYFTVYYKFQDRGEKKRLILICTAIVVAITVLASYIPIFNFIPSSGDNIHVADTNDIITERLNNYYFEAETIRIDVSHLPNGSNINVEGENTYITASGMATVFSHSDYLAYVSGEDSLNSLQGDTLVLNLIPPWFYVNGIDIFAYANPQINAYLEGNTLFIDYTYDDVQVVIMPIWGIIRQFDIFKDKNLFTTHIGIGYNMGGSRSANIYIEVE
ncbi:MAG: hypothetical protein LBD23_12135 [Oscillospiraceae bacterium]|nr:hypothetical protein [Oscillospiraceae bacterium]